MTGSPQRAGRYVQQTTGYKAFIPEALPPQPDIEFDGELRTLLSQADRDIARLDAIAALLPNPDLFVAMYVRHEAVLSSQIEGTQSTLEDVLAFEAQGTSNDTPKDVEEVINYVRAMNHGLRRLNELPLSLRLVREIHGELMHNVRGGEKTPGEFRTSQNWIGPAGSTLTNASFVPPPPHELMNALGALEKFLHEGKTNTPLLIRCGLAHAQFETIHPFLDGNGRVGRLLITLILCEEQALSRPLLYLSVFLKAHRIEYYDRLTAIRNYGHWEPPCPRLTGSTAPTPSPPPPRCPTACWRASPPTASPPAHKATCSSRATTSKRSRRCCRFTGGRSNASSSTRPTTPKARLSTTTTTWSTASGSA
jgi:Fic family protein